MSSHRPTQRTTTGSIRVQNDSARELRAFERARRWSASEARRRRDRLQQRIFPMLQASIGAGVSWYVARELFGHEAPIFAGVVAVVCLGMNFGNRLTRAGAFLMSPEGELVNGDGYRVRYAIAHLESFVEPGGAIDA